MGKNGKGNGPEEGAGSPPPASKPGIEQWFLKTAGTIIAGLGTAGAMVVIGSAVLWVRFSEAGIPAVQAISVQPKEEALVQGAQVTITFVLIALAVVVGLYVTDFRQEKGSKASNTGKDKDHSPDPGVKRSIEPWTRRCIAAIPFAGILWLILGTSLGCWWVVRLSVLALAMTAACLWVGRSESKNFWALAVSVFVAIIAFSGVAEYAIVQSQKYVQAVAILRGKEDAGLTGYYVATTEKKLYFANSIGVEGAVKPEGKPLQEVALNEEVTYSIGPLENQPDATARASSMLKRLIADREGTVAPKAPTADASLPPWVDGKIAATFGASFKAYTKTPESLCMMRLLEAKAGTAKGPWWMPCKEAEAQASIEDARARFALPRRFQKNYDKRVRVEVPAGTELRYVEGDTAPQCGGEGSGPCGHRYPGGGIQYWIDNPEKLGDVSAECTTAATDEDPGWQPCKE